eukprot:CAMPEP_0117751076 /NCGR_PEP_ID=MMETSP0947-20121206/10754_1 /TAXON_ID=44440 /ORGANISM="Chattonella subsalsa, Strain CCMP2191" /LENGTH=352 /DNA_ID=CAMNT_0005569377 /DNA_START=67 /DNA_END=1125 /DNA_ORIENTATION=-
MPLQGRMIIETSIILLGIGFFFFQSEAFIQVSKLPSEVKSSVTLKMGFRSTVSSTIKKVIGKPERSDKELKEGIAGFYDASSGLWEDVWGEHMHHGYYPLDGTKKDHREAQVDMIEEVLSWAGVEKVESAVDVGCGIGGSSRHIARKYGSKATGITLSPIQAARANQISEGLGLGDQCSFQVADALDMPFEDNNFDLVWSLESGEHMPEKQSFVKELARVCAPGGRIIIVTWCHRDLGENEQSLTPKEERLLNRINRTYYLPRWCSVDDYIKYAEEAGLQNIKRADWTDNIQDFWPAVLRSAASIKSIKGLFKSGPKTIRGAIAMLFMIQGYNRGLIKFGLITATKPSKNNE